MSGASDVAKSLRNVTGGPIGSGEVPNQSRTTQSARSIFEYQRGLDEARLCHKAPGASLSGLNTAKFDPKGKNDKIYTTQRKTTEEDQRMPFDYPHCSFDQGDSAFITNQNQHTFGKKLPKQSHTQNKYSHTKDSEILYTHE